MLILVRIIGIIIAVMGIIFLLNPKKMKQVISFWGQGKRFYTAGVLRVVFGIIFLLSASQSRVVGIIITLGILFLIGGITIFAMGLDRVKSVLSWWDKRPLIVLRLGALIALAVGALVLYSA